MKRTLIVAAVLVVLGALGARRDTVAAASKCTVPKAWGSLRAMFQSSPGAPMQFAFEDAEGTVRVTVAGCKPGAILDQIDRN